MRAFDVQSVEIKAPIAKTFDYVANAQNLPEWTSAFKGVTDGRALLETPDGSVEVGLAVSASREQGTVDWLMTFPDGNVARAYSRIVDAGSDRSIFVFVLMAPPAHWNNWKEPSNSNHELSARSYRGSRLSLARSGLTEEAQNRRAGALGQMESVIKESGIGIPVDNPAAART